MRWIPASILALILAFVDTNITSLKLILIVILLAVSYFQALHFDNQLVKFLAHVLVIYRRKNT